MVKDLGVVQCVLTPDTGWCFLPSSPGSITIEDLERVRSYL